MRITIFIPISRDLILERLFASLEMLHCERENVSLFTYVDSKNMRLYEKVRNYTQESKFGERICIQRRIKGDNPKEFAVELRRKRISDIKNESRQYINNCDYVFGIEDDTIVPPHALKSLLKGYSRFPHAGFIQGVEVGRWGVPYVGAWKVDDIYETKQFRSLMPENGLKECDTGGFYCYLTPFMLYDREYQPFDNNSLGPDAQYGIELRREGYKNYTDWGVKCAHHRAKGEPLTLFQGNIAELEYNKHENHWRQNLVRKVDIYEDQAEKF